VEADMMEATSTRHWSTEEIQQVQQRLRDRYGYRGPIDGILGPQTVEALKECQPRLDLPATGVLDEATWARLMPGPDPEPVQRPNLHMLADLPGRRDAEDLLGFTAYADAIAGIIDNPETGTPLTVAISAPWGAGKSTLAHMVRTRLEQKRSAGGSKPHVTCDFNAWVHDDARNLGSAFAGEVARAANRQRPLFRRLLQPIPWSLATAGERTRQLVSLVVVAFLLVCLLAWWEGLERVVAFGGSVVGLLGLLTPEQIKKLSEYVSNKAVGTFLLSAVGLAGKLVMTGGRSLSSFVKDPETAATRGTLKRVHEQLGKLIRQATPRGSRFVIFIDDLERCRPPRAVDLLEIVNQMLSHENVVTVIMADMPAVAACAEIKYKTLADRYNPADRKNVPAGVRSTYGRLYLQKIVQLQFDIPVHVPDRIRALVASLIANEPQKAETPTTRTPAWQRAWRRVQLAGLDVWNGASAAVASSESRKLWLFGLLGVALLGLDAMAWPLGQMVTRDVASVWSVRAAALGLILGSWIAFVIARRSRSLHISSGVSVMLSLSVGVVALDRWGFDYARLVCKLHGPEWLAEVVATPRTSWFWINVAWSLLGTGVTFVLYRRQSLLSDPARAAAPAEQRASSAGAVMERAARAAALFLAAVQAGFLVDRVVLVHDRVFTRLLGLEGYRSLATGWRVIAVATLVLGSGGILAYLWTCGRDKRLFDARRAIDLELAHGRVPSYDPRLDDQELQAFVAERKLLHVINDSTLVREAYDEVAAHLHQLPRNAKRAINRLRLLLYVAYARESFGGEAGLTPRHIGRWVAFQERWPEVADLMIGDPELMKRLEDAPDAPGRQALLGLLPEAAAKSFSGDEDLCDFLAERGVRLGDVMEQLVQFPPAKPTTAVAAATPVHAARGERSGKIPARPR
jgi:hypothetical protein